MTHSNTYEIQTVQARIPRKDKFEQVYHFTLNNLTRSNEVSISAPLQILRLLSDSPRNHTIYALELWLFCEARKIFNTAKTTSLRKKAVHLQIVQRFVMQLAPEKRSLKQTHVQRLINSILKKMGFDMNLI